MNKKLMIIAGVAIVGTAAFFFFKNRKKDENPGIMQPQTAAKQPSTATAPIVPQTVNPALTNPAKNANQSVIAGTKGYAVYPKGTSVNVRKEPSTTSAVMANFKNGKQAGTTTGKTQFAKDGVWYQITLPVGYGWVRNDVVELVANINPTIQSWIP